MKQKTYPAYINEKDIMTDFILDFMQDWNIYRKDCYHAVVGAPIGKDLIYLCEWSSNGNWISFRPVNTWANKATRADNNTLAVEFNTFLHLEENRDLRASYLVNDEGVFFNLYFIHD